MLIVALSVLAAAFDLRRRRVPNWLVVTALLAALFRGWQEGGHGGGVLAAAEGAASGAALVLPWLLGWVRAGDVKLAMAAGALAGWPEALGVVLVGVAAAGVGAFIDLCRARQAMAVLGGLGFGMIAATGRVYPWAAWFSLGVILWQVAG